MKYSRFFTVALAMALLGQRATQAAPPEKYKAQSLLKVGDKIGDTGRTAYYGIETSSLNDKGQLLFVTNRDDGANLLFQYADGTFTPILIPGQPGPAGTWPAGDVWESVSMNQNGDAVFTIWRYDTGRWFGTFRWDAAKKEATTIAKAGMPAVGDLTFTQPGAPRPAINNPGDMVFPAEVKNAAGQIQGYGVFFRGRDGVLQTISLPGQQIADSAPLQGATYTANSINDTGRVSLVVRRQGQSRRSALVWEGGVLSLVAPVGTEVAGGRKIVECMGAWVNNTNRNVLVHVVLDRINTGPRALYLWDGSKLNPVVTPGQPMPGGGQFVSLVDESVSFANQAGQHAFYGLIRDGSRTGTAAYLLDPDGSLSVILRSGDMTELGQVERVGEPWGIGLNTQGQVALAVKYAGSPVALTLLTPVPPSAGPAAQ